MAKHLYKKRAKLKTLNDELNRLYQLNYYHQPEDVEDLKNKIKIMKDTGLQ